ncbi:MAG: hypothetical protein NVSMB27_05630 [Ktedonobacteraceae bacterium]
MMVDIRYANGRPGPARALVLQCTLRWLATQPVFLLNVSGNMSLQNRVISSPVVFEALAHPVPAFSREADAGGTFIAPLSRDAVMWIEEARGQHDVSLTLVLNYQYQDAILRDSDRQLYGGSVHWGQTQASAHIPRSDWFQRLREMEWSDTAIFEISVMPLQAHPPLTEALRLLHEAQEGLRAGDYKGVLARCREAFESAALYTSPSGNTKEGFELLLADAFPEDEAKRVGLDVTIKGFSKYLHAVGRHAQVPALIVTRGEAEFALATAVSLFSLLSRRLTQQETL